MAKKSEYGQFCPVAMTSEILAVRWTPLPVRELLCGSHRFSDLQKGLPLISPSLLSTRLRELGFAGVIERKPAPSGKGHEYYLTPAGEELCQMVQPQHLCRFGENRYGKHLSAALSLGAFQAPATRLLNGPWKLWKQSAS